ncbi:MAG: SMP-30/gluconolactonase/LRE family protein [Alphaproteobacteria bacterium]
MAASDYEVLDERFRDCVNRTSHVQKLWTGARWTEGPVYFPAAKYLLFSDIPNDRIMRYDETDGSVSVFRTPCGYANGHTVDRQGRLVSCEHGGRRVSRTEIDGTITTIADSFQGKKLNSPNDVVVKSDGSVWFTDPPFGILSDYEGHKAEPENGFNVYRVDGQSGAVTCVADDFIRPNGLAFSADEKQLYIVECAGGRIKGAPSNIRVFDVGEGGKLSNSKVFADCTAGRFDGMRFDSAGRLWAATDDGVHCLEKDGTLIGKVKIPEICANVVFGGAKRNMLYITATNSLYGVLLHANGLKTF